MINKMILHQLCEKIGCQPSELKLLGGYNQNVFEFGQGEFDESPIVAKILEFNTTVCNQVLSEMEWVDHLLAHGFKTPKPLRLSKTSNSYMNKLSDGFCFIAFEKARGNHVNTRDEQVWNTTLFKSWGKAMGQMHTYAKNYHPSHSRLKWFEHDLFQNKLSDLDVTLKSRWTQYLKQLSELTVSNNGFGLIHGDLHHHNFLVHNGELTILDFGDSEYHWFAYDIAISVYHAVQAVAERSQKDEFAKLFFQSFMEGYTQSNSDTGFVSQVDYFIDYRYLYSYIYHFVYSNPNELTEVQRTYLDFMRLSLLEQPSYLGFSLV